MTAHQSTKLTPTSVTATPAPVSGRVQVPDDPAVRGGVRGLYLRITPNNVGSWYVRYTLAHERVWLRLGPARDSDGTPRWSLTTARDAARKALAQVDRGIDPRDALRAAKATARGDGTLRKVIDLYWADRLQHARSGAETRRRLMQVFAPLLDRQLDDIDEVALARMRRRRLGEVTPQSWNRDYAALRALYGWAMAHGHASRCPLSAKAHKAKAEDGSRVRWLGQHDPAERARFTAALARQPDYLQVLVGLALWTGCRRGELFSLTWGCVDLDRAQLTVEAHTAKSARRRVVPLPGPAVEMLRGWKPSRAKPDALVVPSPVGGGRLVTIKRAWASLCREAGVADFRFHDCRHDYASALVTRGVDIFTVSKLLGHADPQLTASRYAHLSEQHKLDAVRGAFG